MPDSQLMKIFNFTPDDLLANEQGELSARQVQLLKQAEAHETTGLLFGLGILGILGLVICGICFALFNVPVLLQSASELVIAAGVLGALGVVVVLWVNWQGARERAKLPAVSTVSGVAHFFMSERGVFYVQVDNLLLKVTEAQFRDLQMYHRKHNENIFYRFYYTTHSRQVLAVEGRKAE